MGRNHFIQSESGDNMAATDNRADELLHAHLAAARRWHQGEADFRQAFHKGIAKRGASGFPVWARAAVLALVAASISFLYYYQWSSRPYESYSCNVDFTAQEGIELMHASIATI
ncbi:MAG: hypothetical protein IJ785_02315 [Bacteroidales bacterium]|nr:hypothetical protein [Bacteroidales bacterium]